jgi:dihydroxyacid dehydratase/phosphogluconate dehydratase
LTLEVSEEELLRRRPNAATLTAFANPARGWERLYIDHVQQADTGADLDFLVGATGDRVSRESH